MIRRAARVAALVAVLLLARPTAARAPAEPPIYPSPSSFCLDGSWSPALCYLQPVPC